jgi:hypothetical protein
MIPQFSAFAASSFLLYLDNRICSQSGYYNVGTLAYPIGQTYAGYNVYSFPFNQIIYDNSISGANILSGVYVNGSFIIPGTSGLSGIGFDRGQVYFDPNYAPIITQISGNYAVKEINAVLASFPDISILLESKLGVRNKAPIQPTGLMNNQLTYPAFFLEDASAPTNSPWLIGGVDQTRIVFNIYFFGESLFQKANFTSLMKDMAWKYVPIIENPAAFPLNNLGYYVNGQPYNYYNTTANLISSGRALLVEDCTLTEFGKRGITSEIANMTTESYFSLITVTAWVARVTS